MKPRPIGDYVNGLQENVRVNEDGDEVKVFVDAAIAKLRKKELVVMKLEKPTYRCPLYGFQNNQDVKSYPNGEIIDLESFRQQLSNEGSVLRFMKIGRQTGLTNNGRFNSSDKKLFVKHYRSSTVNYPLADVPFDRCFCDGCIPSVDADTAVKEDKCSDIKSHACLKCRKKFKNDESGKILDKSDTVSENSHTGVTFWSRNCFLVRGLVGNVFSDDGDSGAVLFGNDGRAWGLIFGKYTHKTLNFVFCLASPLCVALKELEDKTGIKGLKLW
jgi:hypothetical protein